MSRPQPARNAVVVPVVTYAPDPRGAALFASLTASAVSTLNGALPVVPRNPTWSGWTRPLQAFRGAAGLGASRIYAPKSSTMSAEKSSLPASTSAIFASRMSRGRSQ